MKRTWLAVGISVSALAGCSSTPPPPTLTIGTNPAPTVVKDVAGYPAPEGRYLLEITVGLDNPDAGAAFVSGWWYDYALATRNGLLLSPSTLSNLVAMPCASDTDVIAGGKLQCTLVFDVPCGDQAATLSYEGSAVTDPILGAPTVASCPATTGAGGSSAAGGTTAGTGGGAG